MSSKNLLESEEGVSRGLKYEVFLSFRGPDTRTGFTDFLYVQLCDARIRVYRDDEELRIGEDIGLELLQRINESKIAIPIFSKGYAASKWCLKELAQIVECKRTTGLKVMPIFYDVAPSQVRHQTEEYGKAFESHEKYYDKSTIEKWKEALREVGQLKGQVIHGDAPPGFFKKEGELVKKITKEVSRVLKKSHLSVPDYLVGIKHHVKNILSKLHTNIDAIQIFGIYGMGGIGKTTLAKVIYNHLLSNFENQSFLADIRATSLSGMKVLYENLISDILGEESAKISNDDEGINTIKERFPAKKVLILLDDVDEISQLKSLIGERDWFGCGSIIIITSRNERILDSFKVDWSYKLDGLETEPALQLFVKHAFEADDPSGEYSTLSEKAVQIAGGLPLALEIFGSLLRNQSIEVWYITLQKLEKTSDQHILKRLKITYDALERHQRQIFLDIACFFIGEDYRVVIHFWERSRFPEEAMDVLQKMSLIKIQKDYKLWMHDQLRDLGREIVRGEHVEFEKCSRLWEEEEATELFTGNMGSDNVLGINLNFKGETKYSISNEEFARLPNLRFLRVNGLDYKWYDGYEQNTLFPRSPHIFSKLRWLSWHYFPHTCNASKFSFETLVMLDLSYSKIKSNWSGWSYIKVAKNLKVLNLSQCDGLVKTPILSCHPLLERLILRKCSNLVEIDESIDMLQGLVMIDLTGCRSLRKLPIVFFARKKSLEEIIADGFTWRKFPDGTEEEI